MERFTISLDDRLATQFDEGKAAEPFRALRSTR
jgi:metal-responsive CopG/Arc/MetJ family transcriptional regulator